MMKTVSTTKFEADDQGAGKWEEEEEEGEEAMIQRKDRVFRSSQCVGRGGGGGGASVDDLKSRDWRKIRLCQQRCILISWHWIATLLH